MLSRLLLLALLAFLVWRVWRSVTGALPGRQRPAERPAEQANPVQVEDMAQCPVCKTYVTAAARACGRADCPRRR